MALGVKNQRGTSLDVNVVGSNITLTEMESLIMNNQTVRGNMFSNNGTRTKASIDDGSNSSIAGYSAVFPFMRLIFGFYIFCNRTIVVRLAVVPEINTFPTSGSVYEIVPANIKTYVKFPFPQLVKQSDSINVLITKWIDSNTTDLDYSLQADGIAYHHEVITNAKVKACIVGDSINAGVSATKTENMYVFKMRNELRKRGVDIALTYNKAVSGMSSSTYVPYFRNGYLIRDCNLYILALGANDSAISGASKVVYKANMKEMTDLALSNSPTTQVLLLAPTLNENDAFEVLNIQYRAAIVELTTAYSTSHPGRVYSIDLGTGAFNNKTPANYMGTDTAGSRIHPSDLGNDLIFTNKIVPYLDSASGQAFISKLKA